MYKLDSADTIVNLIPQHLKQDPFLMALSKAVAKEIRAAYAEAYNLTDFLNFVITDEMLLDYVAFEKMIDYYFSLTVEEKQELIKNSRNLKRIKGTVAALEKVLEILNVQGQVNEWFQYGGNPGYFKIAVDLTERGATTDTLFLLDRLVDEYKRKSSWLELIYVYLTSAGKLYYSSSTQLSEIIEVNPR